ncbi:hypothetical protein F3Y22_tig00009942pilonHSYRG00278 [Hibiscus syriacus]|uniref:Uncharacterized protein n=1 Tax=Hibiscus syriacus TaxID=106335 RepID=A0A6A3C7S3_HIBSY|nr:hypothetical protein F3Y22_tig00009942pilonHSYRG00278 [Hibiscus syriacus]
MFGIETRFPKYNFSIGILGKYRYRDSSINTSHVDVGTRPVTGLRLYLKGKRSNRLAIYMQHLPFLPTYFQLVDEPVDTFSHQESYDKRYFDKVRWKNFSRVCTSPVEADNDHSIVTGAHLQVEKYGFKSILFLRLYFSTVLGAIIMRHSEWDGSFGFAPQYGVLFDLLSRSLTATPHPQHPLLGCNGMGGKDVIYTKQQHPFTLQPADIQKRLNDMADKRFVDANGSKDTSEQVFQGDKDIISICKRKGGSDDTNLSHNDCSGTGFLSHAINLYLRCKQDLFCLSTSFSLILLTAANDTDKPPIDELHPFLELQLPRQWAPTYSELPLGRQQKQQNTESLQFSFMGPKLYVRAITVDVGMRPVTGLRLYLEGKRSNWLAICMQHLSSRPAYFQLVDEPDGTFPDQESHEKRYIENVRWKNYSRVCTAPVESSNGQCIVTRAELVVGKHGFRNVLFLRLHFSTVLGAVIVRRPEGEFEPEPMVPVAVTQSDESQPQTYIGSAVTMVALLSQIILRNSRNWSIRLRLQEGHNNLRGIGLFPVQDWLWRKARLL